MLPVTSAFAPVLLSHAECRFAHIWSLAAPCLTAFPDQFFLRHHWLLPAAAPHA